MSPPDTTRLKGASMKKLAFWSMLAIITIGLAACPAPRQPTPEVTSFDAELAGDNEVPAVATTASGTVSVTLENNMLSLEGSFMGLESDLLEIAGSPAHIHLGAAGENGPVVFLIDVESDDQRSGTLSLMAELSAELRSQFLAGEFYVNIHTEGNPAGELRAQLSADAPTFADIDASFMAMLTADTIIPTTPTLNGAMPEGSARAILRGNTLIASGSFMGLSSELRDYINNGLPGRPDITEAIHIHEGAIGEAGPFVRQFEVVVGDDERSGTFGLTTDLNSEERSKLLAGFYYVDIHTTTNPGGELRGQLLQAEDATSFSVQLAGDNEVPAVATTATGNVRVGFVGNMLTLFGSFEGLESDLLEIAGSPAHIHLGAAGENGPVVFLIDVESDDQRSGTLSLMTELTAEERTQFLAGDFYVNIHTEGNPGGELRAQLTVDAPTFADVDASFTAMLSADNEVPPVAVASDASGMARAVLRGDDVVISGSFSELVSDLFNIGDAGPAHVHIGEPGATGGVVIVLDVMSDDMRSGSFSASTTLEADTKAALLENGLYINIHTEANQPGEIRGQLLRDIAAVAVSANLSGSAEVPPVMTSASGDVDATLDGFNFTLSGSFMGLASDLFEIAGSAAHVHIGAEDENGPVAFLIDVESGDQRSGTLSLMTRLNDVQYAAFSSGLLYINIHTEGNTGGELRAQLVPDLSLIEPLSAPVRPVLAPAQPAGHHH